MNVEIIVALFALIGTAMGTVGGILASNKLVNHRLNMLEKKMDKHNNIVERLAKVEARTASNTHRIDELDAAHGIAHK